MHYKQIERHWIGLFAHTPNENWPGNKNKKPETGTQEPHYCHCQPGVAPTRKVNLRHKTQAVGFGEMEYCHGDGKNYDHRLEV